MKISLITLTFNSGNTISTTIESILRQDLQPDELLIIDGGSSDNTIQLINSFNIPYIKIISEKDNGIYDAMNKGLRNIKYDIVGFLNSDDFFSSSIVLSSIHKSFIQNDIDIFYADVNYVSYDTFKIIRKWRSNKYFENYFEFGNIPAHPTFYIKKDIIDSGILFNTKYSLAADYDFMFYLLKIKSYKCFYLNQSIVNMRLGGATNKSLKNIYRQNLEIYNIWNSYKLKLPTYFFLLKFFKKAIQFLK